MHYHGLLIAVSAFCCIGLFHPIVIQCEYYFSYHVWPLFLIAGLLLLIASVHASNVIASSLLGVVGCSCMWSVLELFQQHRRVERGWFKANPKHHPTKRTQD